jgi:hypothetical protein
MRAVLRRAAEEDARGDKVNWVFRKSFGQVWDYEREGFSPMLLRCVPPRGRFDHSRMQARHNP